MKRLNGWIGVMMLAVAAALCPSGGRALADTLHLKDGTVLEGTVQREGEGFLYFVVKVGKIEQVRLFSSEEIAKIERDEAAEGADASAKAAAVKPSEPSATPRKGKARRVAVLNFGPPSSWQGEVDSTVGIQVGAQAFKDAIPLLEKDGVTDVIVRINSGGGLALEVPVFHEVFEEEYKPRFRTVGWVESAISAAAMGPYVLEEFYFMPQGNLGACTAFSGALEAAKDLQLEVFLSWMEEASRLGKRDPAIMRAMQIQEPLSATIDPVTGEVTWFQDTSGKHLVNPPTQVLTLNSEQAVRFKFAQAIAATPEQVVEAMGISEYEWAGKRAAELIDAFMYDAHRTQTKLGETLEKYGIAVQAAESLNGDENRARRGAEVGRALRFLRELKRMLGVNPNFALLYGERLSPEWFEVQEEHLRDLMR